MSSNIVFQESGNPTNVAELAFGGNRAIPLNGPITEANASIKIIEAVNGDAVIASLELDNQVAAAWNNWTIDQGQRLYFGSQTVTSLTLTSGNVVAYANR